MELKTCTRCESVLPTAMFHKNKRAKDGLSYYCKLCTKEYMKAYHKANYVPKDQLGDFGRMYLERELAMSDVDDGTRKCSRCKRVFPATLQYFYKHWGNKTGLHPWCKDCAKQYQREKQQGYRKQRILADAIAKDAEAVRKSEELLENLNKPQPPQVERPELTDAEKMAIILDPDAPISG